MAKFESVNTDDKLLYELMPYLIGIGPNEELLCYGTCFIAAPRMVITARHVMDYLLKEDPGLKKGVGKFEYWVAQVTWSGNEHSYVVWHIESITISPHSDIAIIWLKEMNDISVQYRDWKVVPMTFDPPPIGATVRAFGIHNINFDGSRVNPEGKFEHIEFKSERSISTGIVKQHFWSGRDKGMYNFPCFEVDSLFEHGMSGGLVIDEQSRVCGIVCGCLPATTDTEDHISYVTMLWPMMAIPIFHNYIPGGIENSSYRLQDFCAKSTFKPIGWDRVLIKDDLNSGGGLTINYKMKG